MITIKRDNQIVAVLDGPIFLGPCIIQGEENSLICCIPDGIYHIIVSDKHGKGITILE